ncbi:MAG: patatin-like phospholipase family protein [Parcubacteria group bacterium]|jgi:NTE family protein
MKRPKIGLALGAGGPRGLAHIGVIKVLEENNIPIDYIAGTSIGAMIGGFYAYKKDIKQIEKIALGIDRTLIFSLLDPSFSQGLLGGEKVVNFIEKNIDKVHFDDLKIPLSVVATNFKSGDAVVITKGKVSSAIRASISLPLVFNPVHWEGKVLADGGLSQPVPVDVLKNMGAELIIAVNLNAGFFASENTKDDKFGFYKIAENSIDLLQNNLARQNVKNADVVINPHVGDARWAQLLDGEKLIVAGEDATEMILPQLKELMSQKSKGGLRKYVKSFIKKIFG